MTSMHDKVDVKMLAQLHELLGERFVDLIRCFCDDGERRLNLLRAAITTLDFTVIHAEAHGLKGSSHNVGANQLGALCEDLEQKGRERDGSDVATLFAAVEQEFAAACNALRQYS
jgi:histidine phosphotransfer protein HptB